MKKLMSVVLVLVVLCTSVISACAEVLTIEKMQEHISDVVGYKPYYIVEDCGDGIEEWTFIMHGGVIGTWSDEEDIKAFLQLAADYQYDWYQQLPEMVEITTEQGLDIPGQGIHFEVNLDETTDASLVIDWMVWSQKIEEFEKTEDGYIFSRKELAKLVYADEMASIRYWAELLEEATN